LRWINRIIGAALIAAAMVLWQTADAFPQGARHFPRFAIALVAILSTIMVVRSFIPAVAPVAEGEGIRSPLALLRPLAVFAATAAALVGASYIGFFPAMAVLLVLLWPILQVQNWEKYSIACILLLGFVYVVFVMILGVPLTSLRLMSM
jgi:hypothetical protein